MADNVSNQGLYKPRLFGSRLYANRLYLEGGDAVEPPTLNLTSIVGLGSVIVHGYIVKPVHQRSLR